MKKKIAPLKKTKNPPPIPFLATRLLNLVEPLTNTENGRETVRAILGKNVFYKRKGEWYWQLSELLEMSPKKLNSMTVDSLKFLKKT